MFTEVEQHFTALCRGLPRGAFASLRAVHAERELLAVRRGVVQPPALDEDTGAMWTVALGGGTGYAATADLTRDGLRRARERAEAIARRVAAAALPGTDRLPRRPVGSLDAAAPADNSTLASRLELLRGCAERLGGDPRIVDWQAGLLRSRELSLLLTSEGGRVEQSFGFVRPSLRASAHDGGETQTRTFLRDALARQGGMEVLAAGGFLEAAPRVAEEAIELLYAPPCPAGRRDLLLAPDQVILQVHESIGHPLELDRILGDERNYAGRSFVTPEMFGRYRYGSELLNVTSDPSVAGELASFAFDDEGAAAERVHLIRDGLLLRPLGGALSEARSGLPGAATARAAGWNRPPIDRMANLNLEPGRSSLAELVAGIERGVYMETNCSWSIDDARDKFQFGCERGRLIVDGALAGVVRNPGYRGTSARFWRSLDGVGDRETWQVLGTYDCGKGEPNQAMRVGHAAPACRFRDVDVFGGA